MRANRVCPWEIPVTDEIADDVLLVQDRNEPVRDHRQADRLPDREDRAMG